ncbi:hypothetical protein B0A52_00307 [Exophiala mesophila]|uniref:Tyrosine specific protein phosphatases domain-containing protein n=1 Tax=Exophiala mesophila TaxID=212818 RepID=A0A438NJN2_EXOME|nr:hypothetical protein B0A52_00307 [Exophiala mesophila]
MAYHLDSTTASTGGFFHVPHTYTPTLPYNERRHFDTPRVHVPPAEVDYHEGKPSIQITRARFNQVSTDYGSPAFINSLAACHELTMTHNMLSWKYEMRRAGQRILPFLSLGPSSVARDVPYLKAEGVTLMIAVRSLKAVETRPTFLNPTTFSAASGIPTLAFDFDSTYDFISGFRPIIRHINDHLEATCTTDHIKSSHDISGRVLVFCESGNDRSSLLVAAYLIVIYGVTAFSAIQIVQSQRFCISMSDDMKNILVDLQHIVQAERSSPTPETFEGAFSRATESRSPLGKKRNIEQLDSDDEMEDELCGVSDVISRKGIPPFVDAAD